MLEVLTGFGVVFLVIAVGYVLAARETLGDGGRRALATFVYAVATPALLFDQLTTTGPSAIFNAGFLTVALSALATGFLFFLVCRYLLRYAFDESIIGMLSASYANGANLGIPLAAAIVGDISVVVPVLFFQVAFYAPLTLTAMDVYQSKSASWVHNLIVPFRNPMLIASLLGILVMLTPVDMSTLIEEPVRMLAGTAAPLALVVFGMSLHGSRLRLNRDVSLAVFFKNVVHPLVAAFFGAQVFGMGGEQLFAAIFLGALPTAQNVNTYAIRFGVKEDLARDTGLVSTLTSVPVLIAITMLWG